MSTGARFTYYLLTITQCLLTPLYSLGSISIFEPLLEMGDINQGTRTIRRTLLIQISRQTIYHNYLVKCRTLKRPPKNLRLRGMSYHDLDAYRIISQAETVGLEQAITKNNLYIQNLKRELSDLDDIEYSLQFPVDNKLIKNYSEKLSRRLNHYNNNN